MSKVTLWVYIIGSVSVALLANSLSSIWGKSPDKFSFWLLAMIAISPFVFIIFGLVTSKIGLAISSGVVDSLLTISTIVVGLVVFHEWSKVSFIQYIGMALALTGILLMLFFPKTGT